MTFLYKEKAKPKNVIDLTQKIRFRISKYQDEYFIVTIMMENINYIHYLCDQFEGLIECIENITQFHTYETYSSSNLPINDL